LGGSRCSLLLMLLVEFGQQHGAKSAEPHFSSLSVQGVVNTQRFRAPPRDDQQLTGLRYDNWKLVFMEQRAPGTLLVWANPFTNLRVPKIFNLRTDPYERADITSNTYYDAHVLPPYFR
jgi:hypothetical protein